MESIRVIMLRNWHFDILNLDHWQIAWDLWSNSWVISEPKEWAFVLIIISFIPLWLTGWIALSMVAWGKAIWFVITLPWKLFKNFFYKPVKIITTSTGVTPIRRKRSYKEIRPRALRSTPSYSNNIESTPPTPISIPVMNTVTVPVPNATPAPKDTPSKFDHALFKFDDVDELDFDIDAFDITPEKKTPPRTDSRRPAKDSDDYDDNTRRNHSERDRDRERDRRTSRDNSSSQERNEYKRNNNERTNSEPNDKIKKERQPSQRAISGSCADIIKQKGYEVISRVTVKNTVIDYVGVSANRICLCLLDREPGDWLADEECFNDEEPLWFSENSHRISPVRKIDLAKNIIADKLEAANLDFKLAPFVIIQIGNIINAEDMFEIWDDMKINVTRIDRGMPKEIKLFARTLPDAEKPIAPGKLDKLLSILRNIN